MDDLFSTTTWQRFSADLRCYFYKKCQFLISSVFLTLSQTSFVFFADFLLEIVYNIFGFYSFFEWCQTEHELQKNLRIIQISRLLLSFYFIKVEYFIIIPYPFNYKEKKEHKRKIRSWFLKIENRKEKLLKIIWKKLY